MLNRLLGKGSYESFDMRCMVTGQFSVGKTTLVKLLAGDVLPEGRHPTDGISLVEGRCGLDILTKEWILVDPGEKRHKYKHLTTFKKLYCMDCAISRRYSTDLNSFTL